MKKLLLLCAVLLFAAPVSMNTAVAGYFGAVEPGVHNSAAVDRGFGCGMGPAGATNRSHATLSDSGNETMHCETNVPNNFTQPLKITGALCGLRFTGVTTDMRFIWTPGGAATLRCQN